MSRARDQEPEGERANPSGTGGVRTAPRSRLGTSLASGYLIFHLGYFSVLPLLAIILSARPGVTPGITGAALFALALSVNGASLVAGPAIERLPLRQASAGALVVSAAAFAALALTPPLWAVFVLLVVAGSGMSANGALCRTAVVVLHPQISERLPIFSAINVAVNVSAAVGPLAGGLLYARTGQSAVFLAVAGCYAAGAAAMLAFLPPAPRPPEEAGRRWWHAYTDFVGSVRVAEVRRFALVTAVGWVAYAQLFSALPLFLRDNLRDTALLGVFFAENAVLIVVFQRAVSAVTARLLRRMRPVVVMCGALGVFAVAFAGMAAAAAIDAAAGRTVFMAVTALAVAAFTVGEMSFVPTVDAAFGDLPVTSLMARYNVRQVAHAVGESTGAFVGASGYLLLKSGGGYWPIMAGALTVVAVVLTWTTWKAERRASSTTD